MEVRKNFATEPQSNEDQRGIQGKNFILPKFP